MKWFLDTEFYEMGDAVNADMRVKLISIGMTNAAGETFYAENANFDWNTVPKDHWLQDNVRPHLVGGENLMHPAMIRRDIEDLVGSQPSFYGWYCDYDWVVLMSLWGRMVNQPAHFPKFCMDLRQMCAERRVDRSKLPKQTSTEHHALADAKWNLEVYNAIKHVAS